MSLPEPMGFWGWIKWNYQGRPDLAYKGRMLPLWAVGPHFQFPGEKRWVVAWSRHVEEQMRVYRTAVGGDQYTVFDSPRGSL